MNAPKLDKGEPRIRRMFGEIAPVYDRLNHVLSLNIDKLWRKKTVRDVPLTAGPLLDLCTGTGDLAIDYFKATGGRFDIVGADFCHPMLVRASAKARARKGGEKIHWVEADAQQLPFPDDTFEVVTVSFGLRNVTDTMKGLREMARVAKPGGKIAVLEFSRPRNWFFSRVYRFYFRRVLPTIGQVVSKSPENAYNYLPESVMQFPDGEALAAMMRDAGLTEVVFTPLTFGIATLYVGRKPG